MAKKSIEINDVVINVNQNADMQNYLSLTDMVRAYAGSLERTDMLIQNWLRRRDTIDYLAFWEKLNNPNFNPIEFDVIRNESGTNRFILTAKEWEEANPDLAKTKNMRETASINELIVLSNLESYNAELISKNVNKDKRYTLLTEMAEKQLGLLQKANAEFDFKMLEGKNPNILENNE